MPVIAMMMYALLDARLLLGTLEQSRTQVSPAQAPGLRNAGICQQKTLGPKA